MMRRYTKVRRFIRHALAGPRCCPRCIHRRILPRILLCITVFSPGAARPASARARPMTSNSARDSSVTRAVETVAVAPGIYAFIAPEAFGGLVSGNSMVVIGDSAVLVVDSGHFPLVTRRMIATIRTLTSKPVRFLVNTHGHPDHWMGNAEYQRAFPGLTIISTDATRLDIQQQGPAYISAYQDTASLQRMRDLVNRSGPDALPADTKAYYAATLPDLAEALAGWRGVTLVSPTRTFDSSLTVHLGARDARVLFLGRGNTTGDAVVFVPDARVIATGDLVVSPTPYAYDSYIPEWIDVLHTIAAMKPVVIVPGHGPVEHDLTYLHQVADLLTHVRDRVATALSKGMNLRDTQAFVDLAAYRQRFAGNDVRRQRLFDIGFSEPGVKGAYERMQSARGHAP